MSRLPSAVSVAGLLGAVALFASSPATCATPAGLPAAMAQALAGAEIPATAVSVVVQEAGAPRHVLVSHEAAVPRNPASVMKLVTTQAALELLGPAYTWKTSVYIDGPVHEGVLQGNVYIQGQGDPQLVVERLWLLMRRLQGLGVREIRGDIVLDHEAFEVPPADPGDFDGEPLRPYNAAPDALLINYRAVVLTFTPEPAGVGGTRSARLSVEPPLAGVSWPAQVPLRTAPCGDYRGELRADFSDPLHPHFGGSYASACGEKVWPLAFADPTSYADRAVEGLWRLVGGELRGRVHAGQVPQGLAPAFSVESPTLAEIVRPMNKFSSNVMAQQIFLTLSLQQHGRGVRTDSRAIIDAWWRERFADPALEPPSVSNGAGLAREDRISAASLAALMQHIWASPTMPELLSSLPFAGVDGTLRPQRWHADGYAHLKTGSLRDVSAIAGIVQARDGRRYVVVALVNHPAASAARPALEALVSWVAHASTPRD